MILGLLTAWLAKGATSIDIGEPNGNRTNNNRSSKSAHNGVLSSSEHEKQRVEYPKEADQHKLSQLFGVLRSRKSEETTKELQVRRVSSRKYSETDSDSSSSSDVEAPSVTESELDKTESPRSVESPKSRLQAVDEDLDESAESDRNGKSKMVYKGKQTSEDIQHESISVPKAETERIVRPKVAHAGNRSKSHRPEIESNSSHSQTHLRKREKKKILPDENVARELRKKAEESTKVSQSKSVDINLNAPSGNNGLINARKVSSHTELRSRKLGDPIASRSHESLDKSIESQTEKVQMRKSHENLQTDAKINTCKDVPPAIRHSAENLSPKMRNKLSQIARRSHENLAVRQEKGNPNENIRQARSHEHLPSSKGQHVDAQVAPRKGSRDKLEGSVSQKNIHKPVIDIEVTHANVPEHDIDKEISSDTGIEGDIDILKGQRTGSPYSFSMDSLPSSNPSPTLRRSIDSSIQESSDTDSLSKLSHHEEFSGTESQVKEGSEDDFVVEEISKVRFQRVSKKAAQISVLGKISSSPKRHKISSHRASPQTLSESSASQEDSGLASGGSRGATPEHKRTDSGYSQSSMQSSLSTVTDRSTEEEDDIEKVVAKVKASGNRGNLLSVYGDSRESIASFYSDAGDIAYSNIPVTGEILFGLNYNYKTGMLEIHIKQCRDIAAVDAKRRRSDPYVKTYLLPDKTRSGKRKTKVKKHTLNPTFDEQLKYSISKSQLENRTLWVTVWHNDRFGRNDFLGEVTINFDYYKFDDPSPKWYPLQERLDAQPTSILTYKGDIVLSIRYVPADKIKATEFKGKSPKRESGPGKGQLHVVVKEARNLTAVRSNGFSDPFCKGYLLPERHRSSKQKTAVIKKNCSPVWNHTFIFEDVSIIELQERCLELTIWDYEKLSSNDFLGGTRLNLGTGLSQGRPVDWMDARGEEMTMWQAMLDRPNIRIDGTLILRPNMEKRKF